MIKVWRKRQKKRKMKVSPRPFILSHVPRKDMIIVHGFIVNHFCQAEYDKMLSKLHFNRMKCPICKRKGMKRLSAYTRKVKSSHDPDRKTLINVTRVYCPICGKSHAILPDLIIPYCQILLKDVIDVILGKEEAVMENNVLIDEGDVTRIRRKYDLIWTQKIKGYPRMESDSFLIRCLKDHHLVFMQNKGIVSSCLYCFA